jgi:hypothetical protein
MHIVLRWAMQPAIRRCINLAFALWYSALALGALLALGGVLGPFPRPHQRRPPVRPSSTDSWWP